MNAKPAALVALPAAVLAVGGQLLLLPWDPRANVPVEPGSETLTSAHTWWGTGLYVLLLAALAAAVGRLADRTGPAMAAVGGAPAALLLASYLTHEPETDGFAGLWPLSWLVAAVMMVAGTGLVAAMARPERASTATEDLRALLLPAGVAGAAAFSGFLLQGAASDSGPVTRTVCGLLALGLGYGLGWPLRAAGWAPGAAVALIAGAVALIGAVDAAAVPLWGWSAPDAVAWVVTAAGYGLGAAISFAGRSRGDGNQGAQPR